MAKHGGDIYEVARRYHLPLEKITDFSASINPLGIPSSVKRAIAGGRRSVLHYPDIACCDLINSLARRYRLPKGDILVGNGSTELLYLLCEVLSFDTALVTHPAYSDYVRALQQAGTKVVNVVGGKSDGFIPSLESIKKHARLVSAIFVTNPVNPTGRLWPRAALKSLVDFAESRKIFLILDEAFVQFAPARTSFLGSVPKSRYLIILRSMTKFYAIPGLRLGWMAGPEKIMAKMRSLQQPWSVNALAQRAGVAALCEKSFERRTLTEVVKLREFFLKELSRFDWLEPLPSDANFFLVKLLGKLDAPALQRLLEPKGILIRDCSSFMGLGKRYIRLAVRTCAEVRTLIAALSDING